VFSDTHGDMSGMDLILSKTKPDVIIHCGDGAGDAIGIQEKYPDVEVHIVRGNYGDDNHATLEQEKILKFMGHTIFIAHGDKFNVFNKDVTKTNNSNEIIKYAKQHNADIVLHGHTHLTTFSFDNGIYLLNPGSASLKAPYDFKPSFGCIELHEANAVFKILSVEVFEKLKFE
jgi:putative phosphoesterase